MAFCANYNFFITANYQQLTKCYSRYSYKKWKQYMKNRCCNNICTPNEILV